MKDECKIWMRWQIEHEYYRDRLCRGMELQVSHRSRLLLQKRGLHFEQSGLNEWLLWGKEEEPDEDDEIVLELKVMDNRLFYVTVGEIATEYGYTLHEKEEVFVLEFKVKRMFWEYILLPRVERETGKFELVDVTGKLTFGVPENVEFMDRKALRVETAEEVLLCEHYDYQLRLYEQKILGRKIICGRIPCPVPEGFSGNGRLREIIYF